jgi:hypothetical protein
MTQKNNPSFKGRKSERAQLLNFVKENKKGYFCLLGHPGIGKSALMAEFIKDVSQHYDLEKVATIAYWISQGTAQAQVDFFLNDLIKKTDDLFPQLKEIKSEGKTFFDLQHQLFSKWRLLGEQKSDTKLIVFIDGLDEGADNDIVDYLPNQLFENVLLVYSSRPGVNTHLEESWSSLPTENQVKIDLGGLAEVDIRDLLDEVARKSEQLIEDSWASEVVSASKGNPLYIKLMCDSIEKGLIQVNQSKVLPNELNDYYKAILQRFSSYHNGESLLKCIYSMAAAKDFLTLQHFGLINKLDIDVEHQVGTLVKEVCFESVLAEGVIGYQLFHESLRDYLVKEEAALVAEANIEIIHFCSNWRELNGKWEQRYTLEHYARHLNESNQKEHQAELLNLFQDKDYTATQKKVLRCFDATKYLFQRILETSIALKNPDLQLEAALHLVDLKNEETADAPQVVAMVANNEIELALQRIESFAGSDLDGVKRKFQLYMLCLMELTLIDSKNKPFRKEAIEKLLNHLDAHLPLDTKLLNWDNFFPGNLVFKMAGEWAALGLDFMRVYKRALRDYHDEEQYIEREGPFSDIQFSVLISVCRIDFIISQLIKQQKFQEAIEFVLSRNNDLWFNSQRKLSDISFEIAKQGKFDTALECVSVINQESEKLSALKNISIELAKQGKIDKAIEVAQTISNETFMSSALTAIITEMGHLSLLEEALTYARGIIDDYWKSNALKNISTELAKQGQVAEAAAAMQEALTCAKGIPHDHPYEAAKSIALKNISTELAKQGKVEEAHTYARDITDVRFRSGALQIISSELAKQGRTKEAKTLLIKALKDIAAMIEEMNAKKNNEQSDTEESNSVDDDHLYEDDYYENEIDLESDTDTEERIIHLKNQLYEEYDEKVIPFELEDTLNHIYTELVIQGIDTEAFDFILEFGDINYKIRACIHLATENVKVNEIEKADELIDRFIGTLTEYANYEDLHYARKSTTLAFIEQDKFEDAKIQMEETLRNSVQDERCNDCTWWCFEEFIPALEKKEKLLIGADWVNYLYDDWVKNKFFGEISLKLVHKGQVNDALRVANEISNNIEKIKILASICSELYIQGQLLEAEPVMQRALDLFHIIVNNDRRKDEAIKSLSAELFYQGKWSKCNDLLLDSITSTMTIPEVD